MSSFQACGSNGTRREPTVITAARRSVRRTPPRARRNRELRGGSFNVKTVLTGDLREIVARVPTTIGSKRGPLPHCEPYLSLRMQVKRSLCPTCHSGFRLRFGYYRLQYDIHNPPCDAP